MVAVSSEADQGQGPLTRQLSCAVQGRPSAGGGEASSEADHGAGVVCWAVPIHGAGQKTHRQRQGIL